MFRRDCHPDNRSDVFRPRAAFALVCATELNALDRQPRAQIEKPRALRSIKFVRPETSGIDSIQVGLQFSKRLHHVAMQ